MRIITNGIAKKTISQKTVGLSRIFKVKRSRFVRGSIAIFTFLLREDLRVGWIPVQTHLVTPLIFAYLTTVEVLFAECNARVCMQTRLEYEV